MSMLLLTINAKEKLNQHTSSFRSYITKMLPLLNALTYVPPDCPRYYDPAFFMTLVQ